MLSLRYLRARRKEGFISVIAGFSFIGIMLGVATLIIVMAVMNGFRKELLGKILGVQGHMVLQPIDTPLTDYAEVAARLMRLQGVRLAAPVIEGQALASSAFNAGGAIVRGMRAEDLRRLPLISTNIKQGGLEDFDTSEGVMVGQRLANQLSLRLGDSLTLVSPKGSSTPMGMTEYDSAFVFMPFTEAQAYFNREGDASSIEVYTDNADRIEEYRRRVSEGVERPVFIVDWRQRNATFFSALQVERNVMFMILTLIVFVAALNIISGLIMLVKDKGRDIAILRTMGATRGAVMRIFLITGASIGVVGTIAGFILGVVVCLNIEKIQEFVSWLTGTTLWDPTVRFLTQIPADMSTGETLTVLVMALVLSLLATLYPSWRAAKLDPVEALRYE